MINKVNVAVDGRSTKSTCILTASNNSFFIGVMLLFESLRQHSDLPLVCVDLSLSQANKLWCRDNGIELLEFDRKNYIDDHMTGPLWEKPFMIRKCSYNRVIWIDCDAIIVDDLYDLEDTLSDHIIAVKDSLSIYPGYVEKAALNPHGLYNLLPVPKITNKSLNAGVIGLDKQRDGMLLEAWIWCIKKANNNSTIREHISWWDQGALLWAMHALELTKHISDDLRWNYAAKRHRYKRDSSLFAKIKADHPDAGIIHWADRPKLWELFYA